MGILGIGRRVVTEIVEGCCCDMITDKHGVGVRVDDIALVGLWENLG